MTRMTKHSHGEFLHTIRGDQRVWLEEEEVGYNK